MTYNEYSMKNQINSINISFANLLLTLCYFTSPVVLSEITLDGSMGTTGSLVGPDYQITEGLGQRTGGNLFHSFGQFNINSAESATFSGSDGIKNVISRVTGGQASTIDGAFRSTIPGANVYFLNPSGVIFGENSSLDVQGSFHASTADYLKFKDGGKFETGVATTNPILATAAPEAFGFLDDTPAKIEILGGNGKLLKVPAGETLSLIGGDINIDDRSLYAPSGQVILASAGSTGELVINESNIDTTSFTKGGEIHISHAADNPITFIGNDTQIADIDVSANTGGKVVIRGGQLVMDNASISANTINGNGGGIDIGLAGNLAIDGIAETLSGGIVPKNSISANTQGEGDAGDIELDVNELKLTHGTKISSTTSASGNGGNLKIAADSIFLEGNGSNIAPTVMLATSSSGSGDSGNISINTGYLKTLNSAAISSISFESATGKSGKINIAANDTISLSGASGGIYNLSLGEGDTDNLTVISDKLDIRNGASITGSNAGSGSGGDLFINSKEIILTNDNLSSINDTEITGIHSNLIDIKQGGSTTTATSGDLTVKSEKLTIRNGAQLSASNLGSQGNSGNLTIESNEILLTSNMDILTSNEDIVNLGGIFTLNGGSGNSGNLSIFSDKLVVANGTAIMTNIVGTGNSGNLVIDSKNILLSRNGAKQTTGIRADAASSASGIPGSITINSDSLTIQNGAQLNTGTFGKANSGDLFINSKYISLAGEASIISTLTSSTGNAGNIVIEAENIDLSGRLTMISSASVSLDKSRPKLGNAGNITIEGLDNLKNEGGMRVTQLAVHDSAFINTFTQNTGKGGNLIIKADHLDLYNNSKIFTGTQGSGNSGNLQVEANKVHLQGKSRMMTITEGGIGQGGNLTITAEDLILNDSLLLSASSLDFDNSNNLDLAKSGGIEITTTNTIRLNNSLISAETAKANAGQININAGKLLQLSNSDITTSVAKGKGAGGNISLNTPIVALDKSKIIANAAKGNGGEINISGFRFESPNSVVEASSEEGIGGKINLSKPDTDISGSIAVLPESLLDVSDRLSDHCSSRTTKNTNSFIIKNSEGIPISPGKLIPSSFLDYSPTTSLPLKNTKNIDSVNKGHYPLPQLIDCNS